MAIKHSTTATLPDQAGVEINKAEWNASHTIEAGTITEAMQGLADNTTADVATTQHGYVPKAPNDVTKFLNGLGAWSVPAGSATLNGITAATGAVTIASGNNTGIVWNWANAADSTVAFTYGETTAAINGTSTTGIPNQVLLKALTLVGSTQSPFQVYAQGVHAFSVSPTVTPQILARSGAVGSPTYSFAANPTYGMLIAGNEVKLISAGAVNLVSGVGYVEFPSGSGASPSVINIANGDAGLFFGAGFMGISSSSGENIRFVGGAAAKQSLFSACAFANLGTPSNGSFAYCSDCDPGTLFNSTCASVGTKTGAFARRVNGAWLCD